MKTLIAPLILLIMSACNPIAKTELRFDFQPGVSLSYTASTLTTSSTSIGINELATLTLTLRDSSHNLFDASSPVLSLLATGGSSNGTLSALVKTSKGTYTAAFRGSTAGSATSFRALINNLELRSFSPQITVTSSITSTPFSQLWSFSSGTQTSFSYDSSLIMFTTNSCQLIPTAHIDDDNTSGEFDAATLSGLLWDSPRGYLRLSQLVSSTNTSDLDSSWTPQWGSLVSYHKLNGALGSITNTTSIPATVGIAGVANNVDGTGLLYLTGKVNQGVSFDANDDSIEIPHNSNQVNLPLTIQLWVKSPLESQGDYKPIVSKYQASSQNGWNFDSSSGRYYFYYFGDGANHTFSSPYGADLGIASMEWTHLVAVINSSGAHLYRNGQFVTTQGWSGMAFNSSQAADLSIGKIAGSTVVKFGGHVDDFAIWNASLTASEIGAIYTRQSAKFSGSIYSRIMDGIDPGANWTNISWVPTLPFLKSMPATNELQINYTGLRNSSELPGNSNLATNLISMWNFDEANGATSIRDATGSNPGVPNGVISGEPGRLGASALFNGSSSEVITAGSSAITNEFTISQWVRSNGTDSNVVNYTFGMGNSGSLVVGMSLGGNYTGEGFPGFGICLYSPTSSSTCSGPNTFKDSVDKNVWNHIVITYNDSTTPKTRIYKNGVQLALSNNLVTGPMAPQNQFAIGRRPENSNPFYFRGSIDETGLWSRALVLAEVIQLYRRGANRIKYQVRTCSMSNCSDDSSETNWKGPDSTNQSYFSELQNTFSYDTTNNLPGGVIHPTLPNLIFGNFKAPAPAANRYFQYRAILESDDSSSNCNYGSGATWCSPELKSVTVGPTRYPTSSPTILTNSGVQYSSLSTAVQTLGLDGCSSEVQYNFGVGVTAGTASWYWWNGSNWLAADGTVAKSTTHSNLTASSSAALMAFATQVSGGTGTVYLKIFLRSSGTSPCQIQSFQINGFN